MAGKSEVAFTAGFTLGDFRGRTESLTGQFTADPSDLRQGTTGVLLVTVRGLRTGVEGRDRDLYTALDAERFPEMRFTVEQVEASFHSVTDKTDVLLTINGRMLIRDIERPMTFLGRVRLRDDRLWARGEARLRLSDFGIGPVRRLFLKVRDEVGVSFDLTLAPAD